MRINVFLSDVLNMHFVCMCDWDAIAPLITLNPNDFPSTHNDLVSKVIVWRVGYFFPELVHQHTCCSNSEYVSTPGGDTRCHHLSGYSVKRLFFPSSLFSRSLTQHKKRLSRARDYTPFFWNAKNPRINLFLCFSWRFKGRQVENFFLRGICLCRVKASALKRETFLNRAGLKKKKKN